jgi:hypothetical protein
MVKLCMIMQYITLCTPCMVSHTFIFAIDHAEYGLCRKPFFSGEVTLFSAVDDSRMVAICEPREIRMVLDHTWTESGKRVVYWSDFSLQGVH